MLAYSSQAHAAAIVGQIVAYLDELVQISQHAVELPMFRAEWLAPAGLPVPRMVDFAFDLELHLAFQHGHQLVGVVDEILPP